MQLIQPRTTDANRSDSVRFRCRTTRGPVYRQYLSFEYLGPGDPEWGRAFWGTSDFPEEWDPYTYRGYFEGAVEELPGGAPESENPAKHALAKDLAMSHLRIARPTDNLRAVVAFYRDGLGFDILNKFTGHDGFDGVMLGRPGTAYHLEFTTKTGHRVGRAPTEDNLLVFYLPDRDDWLAAVTRLEKAGHSSVPAFNPYWDRDGKTFEDPDGYRVVLQNADW